jgi:hypothetical protein
MRCPKRYRWLAAAAMVFGLVAIGTAFLPKDHGAVTQVNCDRIRKGMTAEEVEAIFGGPPSRVAPADFSLTPTPGGRARMIRTWGTNPDAGTWSVVFGMNGLTEGGAIYYRTHFMDRLRNLRRRLGL